MIHPARAERAGEAITAAWADGDWSYSTVLAHVTTCGGAGEMQRGIALAVRRFGIQLT